MKKAFILCLVIVIFLGLAAPLSLQHVQAQADNQDTAQTRGKVVASYREDDGVRQTGGRAPVKSRQRPAWVEKALEHSFDYLNARSGQSQKDAQTRQTLRDAREEFALLSAEQDDLGLTHVR